MSSDTELEYNYVHRDAQVQLWDGDNWSRIDIPIVLVWRIPPNQLD
jgi:hypothetical protein